MEVRTTVEKKAGTEGTGCSFVSFRVNPSLRATDWCGQCPLTVRQWHHPNLGTSVSGASLYGKHRPTLAQIFTEHPPTILRVVDTCQWTV